MKKKVAEPGSMMSTLGCLKSRILIKPLTLRSTANKSLFVSYMARTLLPGIMNTQEFVLCLH